LFMAGTPPTVRVESFMKRLYFEGSRFFLPVSRPADDWNYS